MPSTLSIYFAMSAEVSKKATSATSYILNNRRLLFNIAFAVCLMIFTQTFRINAREFSPEMREDTIRLNLVFRQSATRIDPHYRDNQAKLDTFLHKVSELHDAPACSISSIDITAYASPEGALDYNRSLSRQRARNIAEFLKERLPDLPDSLFSIHAGDINWHGLESLLKGSELQRREDLLAIIRDVPEEEMKDGALVEQRLNTLKTLDKGVSYRYIYRNYFPLLRNAESQMEISYARPMMPLIDAPAAPCNILAVPHIVPLALLDDSQEGHAEAWVRHAYIKTNLPAWLLLWTNIAAEIDIAPHWSANVAVYYSGFNYFKTTLKFRTLSVMPEGRYWFRAKNDGFFIGIHPGLAYYNIATEGEYRYQDHNGNTPAIGGGVSVGFRFALPSNPKWKFEASAGAGIYHLDYDIFYNGHNGLLHERRKRTFYGLDNVAFSICYTFDIAGSKARKGGRR